MKLIVTKSDLIVKAKRTDKLPFIALVSTVLHLVVVVAVIFVVIQPSMEQQTPPYGTYKERQAATY